MRDVKTWCGGVYVKTLAWNDGGKRRNGGVKITRARLGKDLGTTRAPRRGRTSEHAAVHDHLFAYNI